MNLNEAEFMQYLNLPLSREDVAKMAVAVLGTNLGPCHAVRAISVLDDVRGHERPRETRPSHPAVQLAERCEEWLARNNVDVETRLLVVLVFVHEGSARSRQSV
jgi:hypothetical protein